jgi:hypothetical protein
MRLKRGNTCGLANAASYPTMWWFFQYNINKLKFLQFFYVSYVIYVNHQLIRGEWYIIWKYEEA